MHLVRQQQQLAENETGLVPLVETSSLDDAAGRATPMLRKTGISIMPIVPSLHSVFRSFFFFPTDICTVFTLLGSGLTVPTNGTSFLWSHLVADREKPTRCDRWHGIHAGPRRHRIHARDPFLIRLFSWRRLINVRRFLEIPPVVRLNFLVERWNALARKNPSLYARLPGWQLSVPCSAIENDARKGCKLKFIRRKYRMREREICKYARLESGSLTQS